MNKQAFSARNDVEGILLIVDASVPFGGGDEYVIESIKTKVVPVFLVLNKIDLLTKEEIYNVIQLWKDKFDFKEIIPISALKNDNLETLIVEIKKILEEGPKYYPDGMICDHPERFIISEIVREKILYFTRDEVPHSVAVCVDKVRTTKNGSVAVDATIVVERDSQKGIIIGKGGAMIKKIGTAARKNLEHLLDTPINLELFVRVENNWRNSSKYLSEFGYKNEN
jgi:GTP-binding protein Era